MIIKLVFNVQDQVWCDENVGFKIWDWISKNYYKNKKKFMKVKF